MFIYGEPIYVSPDANDEELEVKRVCLEAALNGLTDRADAFFGNQSHEIPPL
ncbi:MAG: hypothetical protein HY880_04250 [Deltaproteobacteria bacterium]|nr:hypothetical protein [Deltaproteobacteria bacterium]